jgi:hypothetical protein
MVPVELGGRRGERRVAVRCVSGEERGGWSFMVREDISVEEIPGTWATRAVCVGEETSVV